MPTTCSTSADDLPRSSVTRARRGLTLIEILIALVMTLIVLGAMMAAFQYASAEMQDGRAVLEMSNRMRVVENLLRRDLANLTVEPKPYIDQAIPNGYFEYIEGPTRDLKVPFTESAGSNAPLTNSELSYLGDIDDILAMTVKSSAGQTFRGRSFNLGTGVTTVLESSFAEVIWWTRLNDTNYDLGISYDESLALHRRVLLVNPDLNASLPKNITPGQAVEWTALSDISVHFEDAVTAGNVDIVANSLGDLANRGNRSFRNGLIGTSPNPNIVFPSNTVGAFPLPLNRTMLALLRASDLVATATNFDSADFNADGLGVLPNGSDVVLTDVTGFDVRVFSPDCFNTAIAGQLITPSDPGFTTVTFVDGDADGFPSYAEVDDGDDTITTLRPGVTQGAYVDLGHHGGGRFSQPITILPRPSFFSSTAATLGHRSPLNYRYLFERLDIPGSPQAYVAETAAAFTNQLAPLDMLETVYDTWTPEYESDGLDQDNQALPTYVRTYPLRPPVPAAVAVSTANIPDAGTNGIDDDGENGVDDYGERETQPPYKDAITGLKVTLRMVEKQTGQVRQSSVEQSY